ncbi:hypothetical protein ACFX2B_043348 [Malus domestica]
MGSFQMLGMGVAETTAMTVVSSECENGSRGQTEVDDESDGSRIVTRRSVVGFAVVVQADYIRDRHRCRIWWLWFRQRTQNGEHPKSARQI